METLKRYLIFLMGLFAFCMIATFRACVSDFMDICARNSMHRVI